MKSVAALFCLLIAFAPLVSQAKELTLQQKRYAALVESYLQHLKAYGVGDTQQAKTDAVNKQANKVLKLLLTCNAVYAQINAGKSAIDATPTTQKRGKLLAEHMSSFFVSVQRISSGQIKAADLAKEPVTKAVKQLKAPMENLDSAKRQVDFCEQFMKGGVDLMEANVQRWLQKQK